MSLSEETRIPPIIVYNDRSGRLAIGYRSQLIVTIYLMVDTDGTINSYVHDYQRRYDRPIVRHLHIVIGEELDAQQELIEDKHLAVQRQLGAHYILEQRIFHLLRFGLIQAETVRIVVIFHEHSSLFEDPFHLVFTATCTVGGISLVCSLGPIEALRYASTHSISFDTHRDHRYFFPIHFN